MNDQRQRREEVGGRVNHVTCGVQKPRDMLGSNMNEESFDSEIFPSVFLILQLLQIRVQPVAFFLECW